MNFKMILPVLLLSSLLPAGAQAPVRKLPARLSVEDAEKIALANNPRITIARLEELLQHEAVRETRSIELPQLAANITAVDAEDASRLTAGALNNPVLYTRAAAGLSATQLLTDFGRTHHLVKSAQFEDKAQKDALLATHDEISLIVDRAFYEALIRQKLLQIAEQTVAARQSLDDEITALTAAKLKSTLDRSFADSELSLAELHRVDAATDAHNSMLDLLEVLGISGDQSTELSSDGNPLEMPLNLQADELLQKALQNRPDLLALEDKASAAEQMRKAEHDLSLPTISATAAGGDTPVRSNSITKQWYGAAGVNLSIPLFTGERFSARSKEADLHALQAHARVVEQQERIERDLRKTLFSTQAAYQRIAVTQQILDESNLALQLASSRYKLGLSNIVELNDAQNAQVAAEIGAANARYAYRIWSAELRFQIGQ